MKSNKRIAINMIAQFITFVIGLGINFLITPYITENVGKEVYGFISLALQSIGYITIFTSALNAMLGRYITISLSQKKYDQANIYFSSVFISNLISSLVLSIPLGICIWKLDSFIHIPERYILDVKLLWGLIFLNFLISLLAQAYGVATYATNRLDLTAKRNLINNIFKALLLVVMFSILKPKVWYMGFAILVCGIWVAISDINFTRKLTPMLRVQKKWIRLYAVSELTKVGMWNSLQQLAGNLINGCDMLITNLCIGASAMTLMGFAKTVPSAIMTLISIISGSFAPQMTMLYGKGDMKVFVNYTKSAIKVCGFICSVPILGFIAFGTKFFSLWLPVLSVQEITKVQILSIMILFQTVFDVYIFPLYTVSTITCKLKIPVLVSLGIGIANIIGSVLLCRYTSLGIYAVQIVSSVLLFLRVFLFAPIYAAHILKEKWWCFYIPVIRGMISSITILIVFFFIVTHSRIDTWMRLIIYAGICGIIGYLINFIIVLDRADRILIKQKISNNVFLLFNRKKDTI